MQLYREGRKAEWGLIDCKQSYQVRADAETIAVVARKTAGLDLASNAGEGVVGQIGFFDRFKFVKFEKRNSFVELGAFLTSNP